MLRIKVEPMVSKEQLQEYAKKNLGVRRTMFAFKYSIQRE
jgi:hypothetical protein